MGWFTAEINGQYEWVYTNDPAFGDQHDFTDVEAAREAWLERQAGRGEPVESRTSVASLPDRLVPTRGRLKPSQRKGRREQKRSADHEGLSD
jgi:hypothetical protein